MSPSTEPITHEVHVPCEQPAAFHFFKSHIGSWWPLDTHGVFGEEGTVAFEGNLVVERMGRESSVWAEVLELDEPNSVTVSWHPGGAAEDATRFTVTFTPDGGGTLVRLVHSDWDRVPDGATRREPYVPGWVFVLGRYVMRCDS